MHIHRDKIEELLLLLDNALISEKVTLKILHSLYGLLHFVLELSQLVVHLADV